MSSKVKSSRAKVTPGLRLRAILISDIFMKIFGIKVFSMRSQFSWFMSSYD